MTYRFLAAAAMEYEDAAAFYESREPGLGDRLVAEVDEAIALALEYPRSGSPVRGVPIRKDIRALLLRSFPVRIIYVVQHDELAVVGVIPTSRRPGYWRDRLRFLR